MNCLNILELNSDKTKGLPGYFFSLTHNDKNGLTNISHSVLCQTGLILFDSAK